MAQNFEFGGQIFEIVGEAALYWRAQEALLVSDLHLEKASAFAIYGQMLPPYDLARNTEWIWITGNHDRAVSGKWGGKAFDELTLSGITLRHEALGGDPNPEISGHFHPKFRQILRGRMVKRRCFVKTPRKMIMPAFGALTGGLDAQDAAIIKACDLNAGEGVEALVATQSGYARFALNPAGSFAKYGRADADICCAQHDGSFKVIGHAHAQLH